MDKIFIEGLKFIANHGVLPQEKLMRQPFVVDLDMDLDLRKPGKSDDVSDTIDYSEVFQAIKKIMESKSHNLLESLAEKIAETLLTQYPLESVRVRIRKPEAPINADFSAFGVEVFRTAEEYRK